MPNKKRMLMDEAGSGAGNDDLVPMTFFNSGAGNDGKRGDGTATDVSSPVQIGSEGEWLSAMVGYYSGVGVKSDNTLWTWGAATSGALGNGTITPNKSSPVQIGSDTDWLRVGEGFSYNYHACVKTDGTLWTWGEAGKGQLGNGSSIDKSSPSQVGSETYWRKISAGYEQAGGVTTEGKLYMWGDGTSGRLGLGNTLSKSSPVQVGTGTDWAEVSTGTDVTLAIKTDGTLWSWGYNGQGQLGDGTTIAKSSPVQVGSLTTWSKVGMGNSHGGAVKTDGTLWMWGYNAQGQLGDGTTTDRSSPVQVGSLTTWLDVKGGDSNTQAIKTDGTVWGWGTWQYIGGNEGSPNKSSPIQIGSETNNIHAPYGWNTPCFWRA